VLTNLLTKSQEIRQAVIDYLELGLSVIPVGGDKKPLIDWKKYQTSPATLDEIDMWLSKWPDMNIGIVTGMISDVVVVDIENGGILEGYPPTAMVKTANNGFHLYYRCPCEPVKNSVRIRELTDVRGEGGYVVAPPSVLTGGKTYEWIIPFENGLAEYPDIPEQGEDQTEGTDWGSFMAKDVPEGERNNAATKFAGKLLQILPMVMWDQVAWPALLKWNESHCNPMLDQKELRASFESIGHREMLQRKSGDAESEVNAKISPMFKPFTLMDLYQRKLPEIQWVVKDLIPLGGITAITGNSNSFKSFLMHDLAASVASGEPFLGHFQTTQGKVLIVDEENPLNIIRKHFEDLGIPPSPDLVFLSQEGFHADVEASAKALRAIVEELKPLLIVFDSLVDIQTGDENVAPVMNAVFQTLRHEFLSDESAIIVIHHHRKEVAGQGSVPGSSMRGSSAIQGAIDAHLAMNRKGKMDVTITQDKLRVQEQLDPFKVSLVSSEEGQLAFKYQGEDTSKQDALLKIENAVLDAIFEADPEPMSVKALAEATGKSENAVREAGKALVAKGLAIAKKGPSGAFLFSLAITDNSPEGKSSEENPPEADSV